MTRDFAGMLGGKCAKVGASPESMATNPTGFARCQLVLIHGITGSKSFFKGLEDRLLDVWTETFSFDLLGFGEYGQKGGAYDPSEQLRHMTRLIQGRFPSGRLTLVGHSLGGVLALAWAVQNRSQVAAIVLLNTPLGESQEDITGSLLRGKLSWATLLLKHRRLAHLSCILLRGGGLMRVFRFLKPSWVDEAIFRDYTRHSWSSLEKTFDQVLLGTPGVPLLRRVQAIPILNLTGRSDDEISRRTIQQPNVTNVILPGGHLMLLEHPDATIRAIEEFLTNLDSGL